MRNVAHGGLVYSTQAGRMCPACRHALADCVCAATAAARTVGNGNVRVARETKGRGGKSVTVVRGLPLPADALALLGKRLRAICASGGTAKDGVLEVQGDHCDRVLDWLRAEGWTAKRSGG
jgi:translation initiation factor 1